MTDDAWTKDASERTPDRDSVVEGDRQVSPLSAYPSPAEIGRVGATTTPSVERVMAPAGASRMDARGTVRDPGPPTPDVLPGRPAATVWDRPRVSGLAVASLVLGVLWVFWIGTLLAIVCGHTALHQIRRSRHGQPQSGAGLAVAGVVLGWVGVGWLVVFAVLWVNT